MKKYGKIRNIPARIKGRANWFLKNLLTSPTYPQVLVKMSMKIQIIINIEERKKGQATLDGFPGFIKRVNQSKFKKMIGDRISIR